MKKTIYTLLRRLLVVSLLFSLTACPPSTKDNITPGGSTTTGGSTSSVTVLSDPNEISKVMIIPGSTLEKGTPPTVTTSAGTPVISSPNQVITGTSGQDTYLTINYSSATEGIAIIYVQLVGSDYYFKIPLNQATGTSGTINIPMRIPEKYTLPTCAQLDAWAATSSYSTSKCGHFVRKNCLTSEPVPDPGKGKANIGGQSYNATAICDLDIAPFGRGYAIQIGQSQFLLFYNMKQGSNQLGNYESLVATSSTGVPSAPFAIYVDSNYNLYTSISGTATVSGKSISSSVVVKNLSGSGQISVSATGNCQ